MSGLREEMADVWDKMTEGGNDGEASSAAAPQPVPADSGAGEVLADSAGGEREAAPDQGADSAGNRPPAAGARGRDPSGRFARGATAKPEAKATKTATPAPRAVEPATTAAPAAGEPTEAAPPKPGETSATIKPPASWRPAAREAFLKAPAEVQAEAIRRERDIEQALNQTTEDRKYAKAVRDVVAPFEGMIRAEGGEPLRAIQNLLQTAVALRTAPQGHKAQLVASLVHTYGVDIKALDEALAGQPPTAAPQQQQQFRDPRVDQLFASIQQNNQTRQQQFATQRKEELASFAQKSEFFEDVRDDMADLIEVAARRNLKLSLEDAYNRAVAMHPEISGVLKQREAAKAAKAQAASTQRARAASSSIKTQPTGGNHAPAPSGTARTDVEAAWESLQQRV